MRKNKIEIMTNEEKVKEIAYKNLKYYLLVNETSEDSLQEYYKKLLNLLIKSGADVNIITNYIKDCIEL